MTQSSASGLCTTCSTRSRTRVTPCTRCRPVSPRRCCLRRRGGRRRRRRCQRQSRCPSRAGPPPSPTAPRWPRGWPACRPHPHATRRRRALRVHARRHWRPRPCCRAGWRPPAAGAHPLAAAQGRCEPQSLVHNPSASAAGAQGAQTGSGTAAESVCAQQRACGWALLWPCGLIPGTTPGAHAQPHTRRPP